VAQASADEYRGRVDEVIQFLDGSDDGLRARLWSDLETAAQQLDFERATKLRQDLRSALALIEEQDRLRTAEQSHNALLVQASADPDAREVLVILRGQIWAQIRVQRIPEIEIEGYPTEEAPPVEDQVSVHVPERDAVDEVTVVDGVRVNELSDRLLQVMLRYSAAPHRPVDQYRADEANIVNRWLFRNSGHPSIVPLDTERLTDRGYLVSVSLKVLSLTDEALESVIADPVDAEDASDLPNEAE
jgi:excinuclease UvrABC nuclease subunit